MNIRAFSDNQKREAYERQKGICPVCTEHYEISEMEGDHITPWHLGGKTSADNYQMLCKDDNRKLEGVVRNSDSRQGTALQGKFTTRKSGSEIERSERRIEGTK